MFQLLYKNHPERLLDALDMATKYIGEGASKDEATLQNLKVRSFAESEYLGLRKPDWTTVFLVCDLTMYHYFILGLCSRFYVGFSSQCLE